MDVPGLKTFSQKVRVRVCGLLEENNGILLLKHDQIGKKGYLWSPPGGGVEFGDTSEESLIREFKEETGLKIKVNEFLFTNEYIDSRFHTLELFFSVKRIGGKLALGNDPELPENQQILKQMKFISYNVLNEMDPGTLHNAFSYFDRAEDIFNIRGHINFINI
ncbi:MAG: NUDIX domain-containing protein [Bacteroidota bacterium]